MGLVHWCDGAPHRFRGTDRVRARVRHRRRRGDRRALRAAPHHLRRLHRLGPLARRSSRTTSAARCCPSTPTPTPSRRAPACRPRGFARRRATSSATRVGAATTSTPCVFCGSGATGAIDKLVGILGLRMPADARRPLRLHRAHPRRRAAGGVHRPLRAPLQRAALARVDRRRGDHRRGRRRPRRPRPPRARADPPRRAAAQDRFVLGRLERHRHHHRHRRGRHAAAPTTGRCRCGTTPPRRPTSTIDMGSPAPTATVAAKDAIFISPAQAHRRAGHSGRAGGHARALRQSGPRRARRRHGRSTSTRDEHDYHRRSMHREEGGTPAIVESIRAGLVFQLKEAVGHRRHPGARGVRFVRRAIELVGAAPEHQGPRQPRGGAPVASSSFVVRHGRTATCTTTSWWRCSTTCSASSRGAAAPVPAPTATACSASTSTVARVRARDHRGCEGIKPGWVRVNFNYFIDETTFDYIVEAVQLVASHGASLLTAYHFEPDTGLWRHRLGTLGPAMSLDDISYDDATMRFENRRRTQTIDLAAPPPRCPRAVPHGGDLDPHGLRTSGDERRLRAAALVPVRPRRRHDGALTIGRRQAPTLRASSNRHVTVILR